MQASAEIVFMGWKRKKDGSSFVKLRVIHNRKVKYFSISDYVLQNDWASCTSAAEFEKIMSAKRNSKRFEIKECYNEIKRIAEGYINQMPVFSFDQFQARFSKRVKEWDYVHSAFEQHISYLREKEQHGYADTFNSAYTALKYFCEGKRFNRKESDLHLKFSKYKKLKFADVTASWLERFEAYLRKDNKSASTIGIYMRNIRLLFNLAINEHFVNVAYPFKAYKPPQSEGHKRALTVQQINQIATYEALEGSAEEMARDMFIFSFLANGMNLADIFRLRQRDMQADEFTFIRQKTHRMRKEVQITVILTDTLKQIIKRHGTKSLVKSQYVFPLLDANNDEERNHRLIKYRTKVINDNLKKIARKLNFEPDIADNISLYFARHSWATIKNNSGANINYIKESLGHTRIATTENYLSSLAKDTRIKEANKLDSLIKNIS